MTRKETLRRFKTWCQNNIGNHCSDEDFQMANNIMALLEQQPCDDCVSRKQAIKICKDRGHDNSAFQISQLPPVLPQTKAGHWIDLKFYQYYNEGDIETTELKCSHCQDIVEWNIESPHKPYYCENCGAKMIEPQAESGDKE